MAGAYCQYCGERCFVLRVLPAPDGRELHLATCTRGMEHDRAVTGYDHTTARNPLAETKPTVRYCLRWKTDASGYVQKYAGQWAQLADGLFTTREDAETIRRQMPNGASVEIIPVTSDGTPLDPMPVP